MIFFFMSFTIFSYSNRRVILVSNSSIVVCNRFRSDFRNLFSSFSLLVASNRPALDLLIWFIRSSCDLSFRLISPKTFSSSLVFNSSCFLRSLIYPSYEIIVSYYSLVSFCKMVFSDSKMATVLAYFSFSFFNFTNSALSVYE